MPPWKRGTPLEPHQRTHPMMWFVEGAFPVRDLPQIERADMVRLFGDDRTSGRVKTYGHVGDHPSKKSRPHYLALRSGIGLHTDPGFTRYSHHVILYNEGYRTTGVEDVQYPPTVAGTMYALDTHSPHAVVPDFRVGNGKHKLDAVVDRDELLQPDEVKAIIERFLAEADPPC